MTCICVHLGIHKHPIKDGKYQDFKDFTQTLLRDHVERTLHAINVAIVMEATKELVGELLLGPQSMLAKTFTFDELVSVLDKCKYMSSPSIWNDVTTFRYLYKDLESWILLLCSKVATTSFMSKRTCSQIKMLEVGPSSGGDLVKRMQSSGDFQDARIMFDHVKCVKKWTIMACHNYDSLYYRVLTIAV
jgi:hypothetical protein